MAFSLVQFKQGFVTSGSSISLSFSSGVSAGSFIVIAGVFDTVEGATTVTISDGHSDTVTDSGLGLFNVGYNGGAFPADLYVKAIFAPTTGATTITATFNNTISFADMAIWEVAGGTSVQFDKVVRASGNSGTADSGATGALSSATEFAVAYGLPDSGFSAVGTGWTFDDATNASSGSGSLAAHQVLSATTSIDATGTLQSSGEWGIWAATFMSGGGGTNNTLTASAGSYTLTGEPATLALGMPAAAGSYTLTGKPATLGLGLSGAVGAYTLTGKPATLGLGLVATAGVYTLNGQAATLTHNSAGHNTLSGNAGSYIVTGQPATLALKKTLAAGAYTLTGKAATLGLGLVGAAGAYTLTGKPATLTWVHSGHTSYTLTCQPGAYVLTGLACTFNTPLWLLRSRPSSTWTTQPGLCGETTWTKKGLPLVEIFQENGDFLFDEDGSTELVLENTPRTAVWTTET